MRALHSINVLMKDGTARRLPRDQAGKLLAEGSAKRFISNTVYRALSLGIEVKDLDTRDEDGKLRTRIRAVREKLAEQAVKRKPKRSASEEETEVDSPAETRVPRRGPRR